MISWNGIGQPATNLDRLVMVKLRDGRVIRGKVGNFRWTHSSGDSSSDIVGYAWLEVVTPLKKLSEATPADYRPCAVFVAEDAPPAIDFAAESRRRKAQPVHDGFMLYFPDAMMAVAEFSRINNEKHNPGERLHWSMHKSNDHGNCVGRHAIDIGPDWDEIDPESGRLHAEALAWRSMALLQTVLAARRQGMKPKEYLAKLKLAAEAA